MKQLQCSLNKRDDDMMRIYRDGLLNGFDKQTLRLGECSQKSSGQTRASFEDLVFFAPRKQKALRVHFEEAKKLPGTKLISFFFLG